MSFKFDIINILFCNPSFILCLFTWLGQSTFFTQSKLNPHDLLKTQNIYSFGDTESRFPYEILASKISVF